MGPATHQGPIWMPAQLMRQSGGLRHHPAAAARPVSAFYNAQLCTRHNGTGARHRACTLPGLPLLHNWLSAGQRCSGAGTERGAAMLARPIVVLKHLPPTLGLLGTCSPSSCASSRSQAVQTNHKITSSSWEPNFSELVYSFNIITAAKPARNPS